MRKFTALLSVALLLAAIGAVSAFASTSVSWKQHVSTTVRISKGGTVKWIWRDAAPHNVKGPGFRSKTVARKGTTYSHRFTSRGTFKIICEVHPTTMKTVVKVG